MLTRITGRPSFSWATGYETARCYKLKLADRYVAYGLTGGYETLIRAALMNPIRFKVGPQSPMMGFTHTMIRGGTFHE